MHGESRGLTALMHMPGLQDLELERIRSSLKSLGFYIDSENTFTCWYYCYDGLAAEDATIMLGTKP